MVAFAAEDYGLPWSALKQKGLDAIKTGETVFDLSRWEHASSAHLAVLVLWWKQARTAGRTLEFVGLNDTFGQLANLGGVTFIQTGVQDAGH